MKWIGVEFDKLIELRKKLVNDVRNIVEEFGPVLLEDFHKVRIVKKDQLEGMVENENITTGGISRSKSPFKVEQGITEEEWDNATISLFSDLYSIKQFDT